MIKNGNVIGAGVDESLGGGMLCEYEGERDEDVLSASRDDLSAMV